MIYERGLDIYGTREERVVVVLVLVDRREGVRYIWYERGEGLNRCSMIQGGMIRGGMVRRGYLTKLGGTKEKEGDSGG